MGYRDGVRSIQGSVDPVSEILSKRPSREPKRKLSAWNKYIKNKRNHIKYRDGKLNLKKMAVAFRRKQRK